MGTRTLTIAACVLASVAGVWAKGDPQTKRITLEPSPKELQLFEGEFHVGHKTKIFVLMGHQSEDRIAAETLAEEVENQTGMQLEILPMKPSARPEEGAIVLARLQDERVRRFLAKNGLRSDELVAADGYLLFSNKNHLVVAANSGQGLFYGVQTLRQLLRRSGGRGMLVPAVEIRDWPTHPGVQETFTQEKQPQPVDPVVVKWPGQG